MHSDALLDQMVDQLICFIWLLFDKLAPLLSTPPVMWVLTMLTPCAGINSVLCMVRSQLSCVGLLQNLKEDLH